MEMKEGNGVLYANGAPNAKRAKTENGVHGKEKTEMTNKSFKGTILYSFVLINLGCSL